VIGPPIVNCRLTVDRRSDGRLSTVGAPMAPTVRRSGRLSAGYAWGLYRNSIVAQASAWCRGRDKRPAEFGWTGGIPGELLRSEHAVSQKVRVRRAMKGNGFDEPKGSRKAAAPEPTGRAFGRPCGWRGPGGSGRAAADHAGGLGRVLGIGASAVRSCHRHGGPAAAVQPLRRAGAHPAGPVAQAQARPQAAQGRGPQRLPGPAGGMAARAAGGRAPGPRPPAAE
jgi:hypothetical protein